VPKLVRQRWEADLGAFGGRRSRRSFSYDAFVPDPVAELDLALPADVAAVVAEAESAVRGVNTLAPGQSSLDVLARQLLRAESVASSRIEGLVLSHRRLARAAFSGDEADLTARSVLANIRAMDEAVAGATRRGRFTVERVLRIHAVLFSAFGDRSAGQLREEQNWIGGSASSPLDAEFVPPPPAEVRPLMEDLVAFLERDDLPTVMQAAIAHAQFETIHPFADGNGRVGRCLVHALFRRRGLTPRFVPPVSLVLATDARAYVGGLTDYRAGRVTEWIAAFAAATRWAALEAERFTSSIASLQERWRQQAGPLRSDAAALQLIEVLPATPVVDVKSTAALVGCSEQAARLAVLHLEARGVLAQLTVGRRNRAWEAVGLFDRLDEFERRLATRRGGVTRMRPAPGRGPRSPSR
jgi:Fic family protein